MGVKQIASKLQRLLELQRDIQEIHPILRQIYPVAVVEGGHLHIFEVDRSLGASLKD